MTSDAPLAGRWDDSYTKFRVLYTSGSAEGALRETLQRFVPSAELLFRLADIDVQEDEDPFEGINTVPISWLATRRLGEIKVDPCELVDVLHEQSLDAYFHQFEQRLTLGDLLGANTNLSRQMSRRIYQRPENYAGICAVSKHGSNIRNYNFFESDRKDNLRACLRQVNVQQLSPGVPALFDVVNQLGLTFEGLWNADVLQWVLPTEPPIVDAPGQTET